MKASEKDIGKLCKFFNLGQDLYVVGILDSINKPYDFPYRTGHSTYDYCQPLSKEEIQQFMELVK